MKPKTMKTIGLILIALGILICIPVTIEKNRTITGTYMDGSSYTEFANSQNDNSGYIFPAICGIIGFILYLVGYMTSYKEKEKPIALNTKGVADELTKLKSLRESGVLTQSEFEEQKRKILNNT
jgi:hypothetical protein